ncbi:hypothetical protein BGW36DRAFT_213203 [Talaromyces proteolyticus]|uniref:Uncharacterized protein n=1 Tax=Talaromyces proteolyticus TaxID=1131652 RepID=A0AAD4PVW6_9EURO|nr:uncharacterized protein BGW36DRAFT_213203 [Talaromyces proteolyticus]KAH8693952.1 hypothetical protein BGW36DRAFT_213203 [Talaromyces proteolyticus]
MGLLGWIKSPCICLHSFILAWLSLVARTFAAYTIRLFIFFQRIYCSAPRLLCRYFLFLTFNCLPLFLISFEVYPSFTNKDFNSYILVV